MADLLISRHDVSSCRWEASRVDDLQDGEARLAVERLALTTNNVTYAVFGDRLGYWQLFPAPEGWGRLPAWGYARAVESRSPALPEGTRWFGVVPVGQSLTIRPAAGPRGVADASPHRAGLS